jgi:demethylmenaquinone methyltransferase/2-methoxy-6-polyprenyl-1,4-benzoquinol methylase
MISAVRRRALRRAETRFAPLRASAHALPFSDARFDRVVAAFTIRNFGDLALGLREMRRVLRPGGRAVILELSTPPDPITRTLFQLYFQRLAPVVGALAGGDAEAYRYLPRSVAAFPGAEGLAARLQDAGFARVRYERLAFGIAAIHIGEA